jgi:hypothetical protein
MNCCVVMRHPTIRPLPTASEAGPMVNQIRALARVVEHSSPSEVTTDPADCFLFAIAAAEQADYLVTGDRGGAEDGVLARGTLRLLVPRQRCPSRQADPRECSAAIRSIDAKAWKRLSSIRPRAPFTVFDSSTADGRLKREIVHGRLAPLHHLHDG